MWIVRQQEDVHFSRPGIMAIYQRDVVNAFDETLFDPNHFVTVPRR